MKKIFLLAACISAFSALNAQSDNTTLTSYYDTITETCGYKNTDGKVIIPSGKYYACFTDTLRTYAIVGSSTQGFIGIDKDQNTLFEVFPFDNGPDYPSEGTFRIIKNGLIGYADETTGEVIIEPQYTCAWPFQNGMANVSKNCTETSDGEYHSWKMVTSEFIDKNGRSIKMKGKKRKG